jgi:hypothetical protein
MRNSINVVLISLSAFKKNREPSNLVSNIHASILKTNLLGQFLPVSIRAFT